MPSGLVVCSSYDRNRLPRAGNFPEPDFRGVWAAHFYGTGVSRQLERACSTSEWLVIRRMCDQYDDTLTLRLARTVKSDAVEEIDKARIAANRIKERKHLQHLQNI